MEKGKGARHVDVFCSRSGLGRLLSEAHPPTLLQATACALSAGLLNTVGFSCRIAAPFLEVHALVRDRQAAASFLAGMTFRNV